MLFDFEEVKMIQSRDNELVPKNSRKSRRQRARWFDVIFDSSIQLLVEIMPKVKNLAEMNLHDLRIGKSSQE